MQGSRESSTAFLTYVLMSGFQFSQARAVVHRMVSKKYVVTYIHLFIVSHSNTYYAENIDNREEKKRERT